MYLCVQACVHAHAFLGTYVEVRRQPAEVSFLLSHLYQVLTLGLQSWWLFHRSLSPSFTSTPFARKTRTVRRAMNVLNYWVISLAHADGILPVFPALVRVFFFTFYIAEFSWEDCSPPSKIGFLFDLI